MLPDDLHLPSRTAPRQMIRGGGSGQDALGQGVAGGAAGVSRGCRGGIAEDAAGGVAEALAGSAAEGGGGAGPGSSRPAPADETSG